jgi:phosphoglycerate dehydrogenase-like enzyme
MIHPTVVISFKAGDALRRAAQEVLSGICSIVYLDDVPSEQRASALESADALLSNNLAKELRPGELGRLANAKLIQLLTAGVDHAPFSKLPPHVPIAYIPGAFAEPMAEHAAAMALAAAKRLFIEDRNMRKGEFNQFVPNRLMKGGVCGILGYGGAGRAAARLFSCIGMKIYAINRSGRTEERVDFIGTIKGLEKVLRAADVVVVTLPLSRSTEGLIGSRELSWMKEDAILVNVSRGEIIDESALYGHLKAHPNFAACIESWWIEPVRHGEFRTNYPFLDLPNVIAAPHNSASVAGWNIKALRRGAENVRRVLSGGTARFTVTEELHMR